MKMMVSPKSLAAAAAAMILSASAAFAGSAVVVLDGTHDAVGGLSVRASDIAARAAGSLGVRSRSVFEALSEESGRVFAVFEDDAMTNEELAAYLADSPGIKSAMPNGIIRAFSVPNDPQYGDQWGYGYIGMPEAWRPERPTDMSSSSTQASTRDIRISPVASLSSTRRTFMPIRPAPALMLRTPTDTALTSPAP